jgi:hypothetical protein
MPTESETGSPLVEQLVANLQTAITEFRALPPENQVDTNPTQTAFLEQARSLAQQFRSDAYEFIQSCSSSGA